METLTSFITLRMMDYINECSDEAVLISSVCWITAQDAALDFFYYTPRRRERRASLHLGEGGRERGIMSVNK